MNFYLGIATTIIELFLTGLPYHVTGQLKILKYKLRNLEKDRTKSRKDHSVTFENTHRVLVDCILRHNNIL